MGLTLLVGLFALASATISSLLNPPPIFYSDSKAKVTNTTFRDPLSPAMADVVRKRVVLVGPSIALVAETMTKVQVVQVPWMTQTLPV